MGPANEPQHVFMPHCWGSHSSFSIFFCVQHHQKNHPTSNTRDLGVPFDVTFTSSVQTREAANSAATPGIWNGRQLTYPLERAFCSATQLVRVLRHITICEEASTTQPFLAGTQTPPSGPHLASKCTVELSQAGLRDYCKGHAFVDEAMVRLCCLSLYTRINFRRLASFCPWCLPLETGWSICATSVPLHQTFFWRRWKFKS